MHISLRQPSSIISRFADSNLIPNRLLDGNDVVAIKKNSGELIEEMRDGNGPALIELITYRWFGHVDWREDIDVGVARSVNDIDNWKLRDPIHRLSEAMINLRIWTKEEEIKLCNQIDLKINDAWEKAMNDPYPSEDCILKNVYSSN